MLPKLFTTIFLFISHLNLFAGINQIVVTDSIPEVEDDIAYTTRNHPVLFNVLKNDKFNDSDFPEIIIEPRFGQAEFAANDEIYYVPNTDYCGVDVFRYRICNLSGCDIGIVSIKVGCDRLKVFNALSPNNDNINDILRIDGLDLYESNELLVFNRWGTTVYQAVNYQNDWAGTFDGNILPDGTYFYMLKTDSEVTKGMIQIQR
ncbi:MAG: gliding motility-associated C-terminal domain-containing protein [Saprospiraceae bacterium]|nr:gliding motility-associated C-terminal domain-containing protein [Saprospiraceae bacterium]MBP7699663.1 gliding motility-associated C-terminal domain-containing protein [Saprospiraceae bacterium]